MIIGAMLFVMAAFCFGRAGRGDHVSDLFGTGFPLMGLLFTIAGAAVGFGEVQYLIKVLAN